MADLPLSYVYEPDRFMDRGKAYGSCIGGRRYSVAHQTPGTTVTGQTSFVATTPTFLIYQASASHRVVLSNFALCQDGTPAGGSIHVLVAIDSASRYSSGGTAITPQAVAMPSALASGFSFSFNPTASAASAVRYVNEWTQPVYPGSIFNPDMHDGLLIGFTGSILIYTWAATTAPTWVIGGFDILEDE
ncbi:MAG: hypothetical protein FD180_3479 [Planctomycetota bacterium]|nr:MAG: hypothetical protein FD180_3479 [Planctomycetota bacterium]